MPTGSSAKPPPLDLGADGMELATRILGAIGRVATASPGEDLYITCSSRVIATVPADQVEAFAAVWRGIREREEALERLSTGRARRGRLRPDPKRKAQRSGDAEASGAPRSAGRGRSRPG